MTTTTAVMGHELACRVSDGVTLVRRLPGGGTGAVAGCLASDERKSTGGHDVCPPFPRRTRALPLLCTFRGCRWITVDVAQNLMFWTPVTCAAATP